MKRRPFTVGTARVLMLLAAQVGVQRPVEGAAQEPSTVVRVRAFVECNGSACDADHLQREIGYVDWVRDRLDSDVEVLVTELATGAGGERYDLAFTGRRAFEGVDEALRYTRNATDTDGEARDGLTKTFAAGLLRYVARTPTVQRIVIDYDEGAGPQTRSFLDDPWNRWVFRSSLGGSVAAEDRSNQSAFNADQSIGRVTEDLKLGLDLAWRYNRYQFDTSDTTSVTSITKSYRADVLLVSSLGSHWGLGFRGSVERSTFRNYDLAVRFAPAVEFNVFPYDESTRRQLRILYSVGPQKYEYTEETVYLRTSERRYQESLSVSLDIQERWGSALTTLEASHFMDRLDQNRVKGYGFLELRVFRGLGVFVEGTLARVRDQINLPRGDATEAEVLLRQRELKTDFQLEGRIGIDVTFGSVFSDVVNARFGS